MKKTDLKRYLKPQAIYKTRRTTINGAFAAAVLPNEAYDDARVMEALHLLDQDPDVDLSCVYCDLPAGTWDHLVPVIKKGQPHGPGHRIGNLVPCCKDCNSRKGGKDWSDFLKLKQPDPEAFQEMQERIQRYQSRYAEALHPQATQAEREKLQEFFAIRDAVLVLMKHADRLADDIRDIRAPQDTTAGDGPSEAREHQAWQEMLRQLALPSPEGSVAPPDLSLEPFSNFFKARSAEQ